MNCFVQECCVGIEMSNEKYTHLTLNVVVYKLAMQQTIRRLVVFVWLFSEMKVCYLHDYMKYINSVKVLRKYFDYKVLNFCVTTTRQVQVVIGRSVKRSRNRFESIYRCTVCVIVMSSCVIPQSLPRAQPANPLSRDSSRVGVGPVSTRTFSLSGQISPFCTQNRCSILSSTAVTNSF